MGRRRKEPEGVHRENIAGAAERLFLHGRIETTTMDDIAKEAGYSKATLYVYFTDKEDLVGFLVLKSMKLLQGCIAEAVSGMGTVKERYLEICHALFRYQEQYPLYYSLALGEINVDFEKEGTLPIEREIYDVGEEINCEIQSLIEEGIRSGQFQQEIPALQISFLFWASLSGLIQMAASKHAYISQTMNLSREDFLEMGYEKLYHMIEKEERR